MNKFNFFYFLKIIFCILFFCLIFNYLLRWTNGVYDTEMFVINGFIGYGLLLFYFIFFKRLYKNLFLFLFSNFLNIIAIILIFDLIRVECFDFPINDNLDKFYYFTVFKIFPFFISAIITELVFSKILNIRYSDKLSDFLKNNVFRILIIFNSCSLFFYLVYIHICLLVRGLID